VPAATAPTPSDPAAALAQATELAGRERIAIGERVAHPGAHDPVLALACVWRSSLARHAPDALPELASFVEGRVAAAARSSARAATEAAGPEAAAAGLDAVWATADLERVLLTSGVAPSRSGPARDALTEARRAGREAFARGLEGEGARGSGQAGWCDAWLERASQARAASEDLEGEEGAQHLVLRADDLAWHARTRGAERRDERRRLLRAARRLRDAADERLLTARLERRFGARRVASWSRLVVGAIFVVLGLLLVELLVPLGHDGLLAVVGLDLCASGLLLADFGVRLAHAPRRGRWFLRHVWLDLLPSIPLAWLGLAHVGGEPLRAGTSLTWIELPRFARVLRVVLPLLRALRVVGFLTRGADRLLRTYAPLIDRDVILHPTRDERRAAAARGTPDADLGTFEAAWEALLVATPAAGRAAVSRARLVGLASVAPPSRPASLPFGPRREMTAEALLDALARATPVSVAARLPPELLARAARGLRLLASWPLCWTPFVRRYVPRLAPGADDAHVVAAGAHAAGRELARHHRRWLWFADLYGTLTPAEFVDRLGTTMMRVSIRPATRLTFFGGFYLLALLLFVVLGGSLLRGVIGWLRPVVETPLLVLGGVCFAFLGVGWWLRRVASRSTAFFESLSAARFLELLETIKARTLARDAEVLERRVLALERGTRDRQGGTGGGLLGRVRAWLVDPRAAPSAARTSDPVGRVALLWRDGLDGALFLESDARTARQLVGNPVLATLRARSPRVDAAERRRLAWLDFDHPPSSLRGPHLWFSFLAQAVVQTVGRLIADYNRAVLPTAERERASPAERARHDAWLASHRGPSAAAGAEETVGERGDVAGDFLALHFLDDDPARDAEVLERYGPEVLERLREDRRFVLRRIFGTYPLHLRPRADRVLNLRAFGEAWFGGGRALLLPLRLAWRALGLTLTSLRWTMRAVGEVLSPRLRRTADEAAQADFATALRKIDRVRGPLADACLWLRARLDAAYLGLAPLGAPPPEPPAGDAPAPVDQDLAFLGGRGALSEQVAGERARARADLARLQRHVAGGLLVRVAEALGSASPPSGAAQLEALTAAYRMDLDHVRTLLSAVDLLAEAALGADQHALASRWPLFRLGLWRAFRRHVAAHPPRDRAARRALWRVVAHDVAGAGRALRVLDRMGGAGAQAEGERRLAEILRHPGRVGEMLLTTRAVQTLSLLDILHYREHVYRVGGYAEAGDPAEDLLRL
jgi:hypothetical protein